MQVSIQEGWLQGWEVLFQMPPVPVEQVLREIQWRGQS
jgi:hypothetical protein